MAVVDKAGSLNNLSSVDTPNLNVSKAQTNGAKFQTIIETVEIASGDDNGSKYRVARLQANAVIKEIKILCDAITGGTDYDLGIYEIPETNSGAVIDADCFMDGQTLASASKTINGFNAVDIANYGKQIWELTTGGTAISEATSKAVDIVLTGNTVGSANGTVTVQVTYALV